MFTTRTTLAALSLATCLAPAPTPDAATEAPPATPAAAVAPAAGIQIHTERHRDLAEWAIARYDEAGLELPALHLWIHNQYEPCDSQSMEGDNNGLYRNTGSRIEIHICAPWPSRIERALLHELGHAWDGVTLADPQRAAFLELRGLDHWHEGDWDQQGREHAAEILMWGLSEESFPLTTIADTDTASLTEAFWALTGIEPLSAPPEPAPAEATHSGPMA